MSDAPTGFRWLTADEAAAWSSGESKLTVTQDERGDLMCPASEPIENWNCLEGRRCPSCGQAERFLVDAICTVSITDDGEEVYPRVDEMFQYDEDAPAVCPQCNFEGTWSLFLIDKGHRYSIETTFFSNRLLTQQEIDSLIATVETQVQEPVILSAMDRDWEPAEWESSRVIATVTPLL